MKDFCPRDHILRFTLSPTISSQNFFISIPLLSTAEAAPAEPFNKSSPSMPKAQCLSVQMCHGLASSVFLYYRGMTYLHTFSQGSAVNNTCFSLKKKMVSPYNLKIFIHNSYLISRRKKYIYNERVRLLNQAFTTRVITYLFY